MQNQPPMLDVSVIIPFKDKSELTISCITTLAQFGPFCKEILLVSNNSSDKEISAVRTAMKHVPRSKLLIYNHPFNFQKINNWAIAQSKGKVVFLLNNDVEFTSQSGGLLAAMYQEALKPTVGAVGSVLLYEDRRTIQHAGVYLVAGGTADHLYIGKSFAKTQQLLETTTKKLPDIRYGLEVSAVTAAALMVERRKFDQIHGLNENFIICGGDVDFCLRLLDAGYSNILVGGDRGYMIHKESKSRSMLSVPYVDFVESYKSYIQHFSLSQGDPKVNREELLNAQ